MITQFSFISPIDKNLPGATTPGQSLSESNDNERVLCILQSSNITGASPSDCLVSYLGHLLGESQPSAEMQSLYSAAYWATSYVHNWTKMKFNDETMAKVMMSRI